MSFDVFGTLLDIEEDRNRPEAYYHLARWLSYHGIRVSGDMLHSMLDLRAAEELRNNKLPYPDVDISSILERVIGDLSPGSRHAASALVPEAALILRTLTTVSLTLVPGVKEVLEKLTKGFRLGICSNTQRAYTLGELRMFGLLDFFEHIVFSSDIQAGKPNPRIFETVLNRFQEPAECVLHIGDRIGDDIAGAAAAGMNTMLFERHCTASHDESEASLRKATCTVSAFQDIPDAIHSLMKS